MLATAIRVIIYIFAFAIVSWLVDGLSIRLRIPARDPIGSVQVQPLLAVPQKGNRTEFIAGDAETRSCSRSVFPQLGYPPCWYLERHREPRQDY